MRYGERFEAIRRRLWDGSTTDRTVLALARRIGKGHPSTVYNIERLWRVPNLPTIADHAAALGVRPWELLEDVETEYDDARDLVERTPADAQRAWADLLARYRQSTSRTARKARAPVDQRIARRRRAGSA